jgi:predicted nucleotidyltransferase
MNIETIREISVPILKRNGVQRAYIFGSFARGDQTDESDIDISAMVFRKKREDLRFRCVRFVCGTLKNCKKLIFPEGYWT